MQNIKKNEKKIIKKKKKPPQNQLPPFILVRHALKTWDNGAYESFGLLENVLGLNWTGSSKEDTL